MLKKIKRNIFLIYYTIRLICKICKAKFILAFILSIINGILPVSSLLVMQQLLNEIQNKTQSYQYVVYLLILYFGLIISESLLQNLASYNLNNLNNHLVYGINYILMKKCGDLSLEMLERTETYDMINRLEQEIGNKPYQTMQGVLGLASNLVSLFSAAMILLSWNPILVIIMIAVSILMFIGQIYVGNKEFLMRYERSGKERKAWYYTYLLTHDTAFKEVKAYGLKKYLLDKYCSLVKTFIKQANEIEKTRAVLNMIISFIQDMGMPANVKGFGYIVDSVLLLEEDSKIKTTYLYFKVAQQHGTTGQRVERAIRHAFDIVRSCRGDYDVVNHYIGFINCANSPSLSMLTMKIREEALEVPEPKPEKKEENVITGITEDRLLELMRQACTEFWADMIIRLKK